MEDNNNQSPEAEQKLLNRRRLMQLTAAGVGLPAVSNDVSAQEDSFVDILSIDPTDYPNILLNVSVDTVAGSDGLLTKEDFQIIENGIMKEINSFNFGSTKSDIVFVFDDTGSMGDEIRGMKSEVNRLISEMEAAGINSRYGLVTFKDDVEVDLNLTKDADKLRNRVNDLRASGGGDAPEDNFDALEKALNFDFRSDAQKILVDITDQISHHEGDGSGYSEYTIDEVATDINNSGLAYVAVSPGFTDEKAAKKVLAEKVDGTWIDIDDADFTVILEEITELVVTAYVIEYVTDLFPGRAGSISVVVDDPDKGRERIDDEIEVPSDVSSGVSSELISQKDDLIGDIRSLAGLTIGESEAESSVDQNAGALLEDIRNETFSASPAQYNETLERMVGSEQITRTATETVTGEESPTQSNLENLFSLIKGVAVELMSRATGGLLRGVVDSISRTVTSMFDDLLRSFSGRGIIADSTADSISSIVESATRTVYRQLDGWSRSNPDQADEIAGNMRGQGLSAVADGASGFLSDLNDGRSFLSTLEDLYFEAYYNRPDWPVVNIPSPDEIELPDLEFSYDVPDEELNPPLQQVVPDEISHTYGTPDLNLPSGLEEVSNALETYQEVSRSGGIDTIIDEQITYLEENIGSLDEQNDSARDQFGDALGTGISGSSQITNTLIDLLEGLQGLLSAGSTWIGYLSIAAVGLAVVSSMTAVGPVVSLGAAGTLATVAGALGIASLAVDGVQIATGQAYLSNLTTIHGIGTHVMTRRTFGGGA